MNGADRINAWIQATLAAMPDLTDEQHEQSVRILTSAKRTTTTVTTLRPRTPVRRAAA